MERVILNKIESIERCINRIEEVYSEGSLDDYLYQDAIVLNLQRACQQAIDLGMYLVSKLGLGVPKKSREAFELLEEEGIISEEVADRLQRMVGFRNIAIHEYQELDLDILRSIIENNLDDFLDYNREIIEFLKSH
ncbi:DUF86 domain-containing protein [Natroniella sulfidigena]|uniref:type VII toxin-antitoxin system HepT family RNase toxin n=1 Tax=Natroniella sulfidigena TaxID=723921 RepID=UPI00200B5CE6|nr:DUF86 domain-containing protein [Natroniella sulfidigena]MCK8816312.1 DUF86 domain-containing protein [Natroniella sulfidigena]